jgi:hypothetical protein
LDNEPSRERAACWQRKPSERAKKKPWLGSQGRVGVCFCVYRAADDTL